jgi:tRNA threonylcarbamoyladenosine biosynthesis protein TsaB
MLLAIETAGETCGVALARAGEVVGSDALHGPRLHAASLAPMIERVMRAAGVRAGDLQAVAVSAGPGSFTGLRIGVSTAKGLCVAAGAALVAVPTLGALGRASAGRLRPGERLLAALPSRRGEAYVAEVDLGDPLARPAAASYALVDLPPELAPGPTLIVGPAAEAVGAALASAGRRDARWVATQPDASAVAALGWARFQSGLTEDLAAFEPDYVTPAYVGAVTGADGGRTTDDR